MEPIRTLSDEDARSNYEEDEEAVASSIILYTNIPPPGRSRVKPGKSYLQNQTQMLKDAL